MVSMSRTVLYRSLLNSLREDHPELYVLSNVVEVNVEILSGIEADFLTDDFAPNEKTLSYNRLLDTLWGNIKNAKNMIDSKSDDIKSQTDKQTIKFLENLEKEIVDISEKIKRPETAYRHIFNKVITMLGDYNTRYFKQEDLIGGRTWEKGSMPQVFLSHAYDDRLYAFALFEHFYKSGIYLYVDWMHHDKILNGIELKDYLKRELDNSEQLLFLRSSNSELNMPGNQLLRPWCAWELGNFYRKDSSEKYLLNLYSVDRYSNDKNLMLHGLHLFTSIQDGLLFGTLIYP